MNNIILTGSSGFIGKKVLKTLLAKNFQTTCLSKSNSHLNLDKVDYFKFDLKDGFPDINIKNKTTLIHLAWDKVRETSSISHINEQLYDQKFFLKTAIDKGISKIIAIGSCYEYGKSYGPISSKQQPTPDTPYGEAKYRLHNELISYKENHDFDLIWARLFYLYGDHETNGSIISLFDKAIENNDDSFPMSYGEQILDYMHVENAAKKIVSLIDIKSGTYNICSGNPISIRRLIENRKAIKKSEIKLELGAFKYRENESMAFWGIPDI